MQFFLVVRIFCKIQFKFTSCIHQVAFIPWMSFLAAACKKMSTWRFLGWKRESLKRPGTVNLVFVNLKPRSLQSPGSLIRNYLIYTRDVCTLSLAHIAAPLGLLFFDVPKSFSSFIEFFLQWFANSDFAMQTFIGKKVIRKLHQTRERRPR